MKWSLGSVGSGTTAPPVKPSIPNSIASLSAESAVFSPMTIVESGRPGFGHDLSTMLPIPMLPYLMADGAFGETPGVSIRPFGIGIGSEAVQPKPSFSEWKMVLASIYASWSSGWYQISTDPVGFPLRDSSQCLLSLRGRTLSPTASIFVLREAWSLADSAAINSSLRLPAFIVRTVQTKAISSVAAIPQFAAAMRSDSFSIESQRFIVAAYFLRSESEDDILILAIAAMIIIAFALGFSVGRNR